MSDALKVELTDKQRQTLLWGLRFVRSSLMLDLRDPDPELDAQRSRELEELAALVQQLDGVPRRRVSETRDRKSEIGSGL